MNINNAPAAIQIVISLEKKMVAATADIIGIRYKKLFVEAAPIWLKDTFQSQRLAPLALSPRYEAPKKCVHSNLSHISAGDNALLSKNRIGRIVMVL